jgi:hypothetical protein
VATAIGLTIEEFEELPDALAHNHELVNRQLVDVSGNTLNHNSLRDAIAESLRPYVRLHKLGRVVTDAPCSIVDETHGRAT